MNTLIHPIAPFLFPDSRLLVLGSFPSVKSRESGFYYGHPQNRFWQVLALVFDEERPCSTDDKKALLARHGIALWDVIHSCTVTGSADASIRDARPNEVQRAIAGSAVQAVFLNGQLAGRLYRANRHLMPRLPHHILPSTSAANAAWSLPRLAQAWGVLKG